MKILLTMGATREYIDSVRFITNLSTGRTGCVIAGLLASKGCEVVSLVGQGALRPSSQEIKTVEFSDFKDLDSKMRALLSKNIFDAVIHLAAVSDYSVASVSVGAKNRWSGVRGKIDSKAGSMTVTFKKNFKIIDRIRGYCRIGANPYNPFLVGFKLTDTRSSAEINKAVKRLRSADLVVHNDLSGISEGGHIFNICRNGEKPVYCMDETQLAKKLYMSARS